LLRIQAETLLDVVAPGRMAPPGPRVQVFRGADARLVFVRTDIPDETVREWAATTDDRVLARLVAEQAPIEREHRGPAFVLPRQAAPADGSVVRIGEGVALHAELVERGWRPEETPPYFGALGDGVVVAACFSARAGQRACEAGVETAAEYRGRGLVLAAIRAWAAEVQESGRLALYSTTWDNLASRRVAEKLGGVEYGEDWHLT
jgi:hypothetical protein